jgi:predicted glutamine amidotransferase
MSRGSPIFIGSQQTQHVELHNGDIDNVKKLMRSKYEAHGGEDNHLATTMDP